MSELRIDSSPNSELYPTYYLSPLDENFADSNAPFLPIITPVITKDDLVKKINYCKILLGFTILIIILLLSYVIYLLYNNMYLGSSLINKYSNILQSNFSNKDQVEFKNENDYDIHYLVEQMIYKEFSPTDKKKYLNLPQALKDSILSDYLITKI